MNRGLAWLVGLVIVVVVGAGGWFGAQAFLPKLDEPWVQQLRSPVAYAGIQSLVNGEGGAASGSPVLFTSDEQGYSVEAPGEPTFKEQVVTPAGMTLTQKVAVWGGADEYYAAMSTFIPNYSETGIDQALDDSVAGMVNAMPGATLRESEKTTLDGAKAIVGVIVPSSGDSVRFAVTFHNARQYALLASEHDDDSDENFIASFTFLD